MGPTPTAPSSRTSRAEGVDVEEAVFRLTTDDVRDACDVLAEVYEATDGSDGRVSIEVDPRLARDTQGTIAAARRLWATVDRPNLFIKIPATVEGLPAITTRPRGGHQRERHADLLPGAVRPGARRPPRRSRAGPRRRDRPVASGVGGLVLRVEGGHRRRRAAGEDRRRPGGGPARDRRDRQRAPGLPAVGADPGHRALRPRWPPPGRAPSARCGPRRAPRTRRTATPGTSRSSWPPTR